MTRLALPLTLFAAVCLTVGCTRKAEPDPMTRMLTDIESSARMGYRIAWQSTVALPAGQRVIEAQPLDGRVVLRESGNIVSMLDAATGDVRWRKSVGSTLERLNSPVLLDEHLLVCSETRAYFLRADNGAIDRIVDLERNASTAPLIMAGRMIFGSPSGRVFAQDLEHGHPYWQYQMGGAITTRPVVMGGLMLVADQTGSVAVLNPTDGNLVWRSRNPPWAPISAQPTATDAVAYIASEDQKLYAFERNSGTIYWQYLTEHPLTESPVVLNDRVFQRTRARGLVCLDALTGDELWRSDAPGIVMQQLNDTLVLRDGNTMHTIDVDTGEPIETAEWPKARMIVAGDVGGGPLYLAHSDGRIMKLTPR